MFGFHDLRLILVLSRQDLGHNLIGQFYFLTSPGCQESTIFRIDLLTKGYVENFASGQLCLGSPEFSK